MNSNFWNGFEKKALQDTLDKETLVTGLTGYLPLGTTLHTLLKDEKGGDRGKEWLARIGASLGGGILGGIAGLGAGSMLGKSFEDSLDIARLGVMGGALGAEMGVPHILHRHKYDKEGKLLPEYGGHERDKVAYGYDHEAEALDSHYSARSQATPMDKLRSAAWGAGIGGIGGGLYGALVAKKPLAGLAIGTAAGAALGGFTGVMVAIADELGIEEAKHIAAMPDEQRGKYLRHLARQNEISEQQAKDWDRELRQERRENLRHAELVSAVRGGR